MDEKLNKMLDGLLNYIVAPDRTQRDRYDAIDKALKLSKLMLNLRELRASNTQEELMEKMKEIDFSKLDINSMFQGMMKGEV